MISAPDWRGAVSRPERAMPRNLAVSAALLTLICSLTTAAAQERAGVVTTLTGSATVARNVPVESLPLKFKDDVFGRDRIATAEQSLVRVLLGGKALVTVRELSTFTITEEAQRAVVDLQSGKIGVAAARQLFRPGERLEIRTQNAVAGIRGTLLIAESLPNGDSLFSVVTGVADICQSGGAGACATITRGERAFVGLTAIRREPIPPGADPEAGLRPGGPQHTSSPAETAADVAAQAVQGATALTALVAPLTTPTVGPNPTTTPPILPNEGTDTPLTGSPGTSTPSTSPPTTGFQNGGFENGLQGWSPAGAVSVVQNLGSRRPPQGDFMALMHTGSDAVGQTTSTLRQSVGPGELFFVGVTYKFLSAEFPNESEVFNDSFSIWLRGGTEPVEIAHDNRNNAFTEGTGPFSTEAVNLPGLSIPAGSGETEFKSVGKLFTVSGEGDKTLKFLIVDTGDDNVDSAALIDGVSVQLDPPRYFLRDGGTHAWTQPSALDTFVGRTETFDSLMVTCCDSTVTLAGPLLHAVDSRLDVPFGLLNVGQGGRVQSTTTEPLVLLERGVYHLGTLVGMFDLTGVSTAVDLATGLTLGIDQPLRLAGPLFESRGAQVTARHALTLDRAVLEATMPLIKMSGGAALTTAEALVALPGKGQLTALAPLAGLDQSSITVKSGAALHLAGGSVVRVSGDLFALSNGSRLSVLNGALVRVAGGSVLNVGGALIAFGGSGGNVVKVSNNLCPCTMFGGVPVALTNGALASNVHVGANAIKNSHLGSITLSPNAALISVSGATSKVSIGAPATTAAKH
jgi:FecR protein